MSAFDRNAVACCPGATPRPKTVLLAESHKILFEIQLFEEAAQRRRVPTT